MKKSKVIPSDAELEILQILWEHKEAQVKDIHAELQNTKAVGYTTVLKTMQIMFGKKLVNRFPRGKSHVYSAVVKKEDIQDGFLDKIIDKVYKGSTSSLVISALGNSTTSIEELEEIKKFIQLKENGRSKS